jgi:hypothetical protein
MPQPLNLIGGGGGILLIHHQTRTLLPGCLGGVVLEVEQVLHIPGQHSLKELLLYGVLLILNWEKHDRQCCSSGEAVLTQGGESDVHHHLNAGVELATDDGPRPRLCGLKGIVTLTSHLSKPWAMDI